MQFQGDIIRLTGLRARGNHGLHDFERRDGQEFVVDVVLELDLTKAMASDDVTDTVHYGELANVLIEIIGGEPVQLLEKLAARLATACLANKKVTVATVTVHKPQAAQKHHAADISVTVRRTREAST